MTTTPALITALRLRIGNPTTAEVTDSTVLAILNVSHRMITNRYRFAAMRKEGTIATVAGTEGYNLESDVASIRAVWDVTNKKKLIKGGERLIANALFTYGTTRGKPQKYVRFGNTIRLYPTPDGVYSIKYIYKKVVADLADGADSSPTPPSTWDEGLLLYSRYVYYDRFKPDERKAASAYNSWSLWISEQPVELDEETVDIDSGVEVPTLGDSVEPNYDFDHSD